MYLMPSIHKPLAILIAGLFPFFFSSGVACEPSAGGKTATIHADTPRPDRFVVRGERLVDLERPGQAVFFRGMGYSPFLPGESPILFGSPGNDGRYAEHMALLRRMNVNYLHLFPRSMGSQFFQALDRTDLVYGQDIYIQTYENDYLHPAFLSRSLEIIKEIIDHTYKVGRPDRLVLFSIGDELAVESIIATDTRHRGVRDYTGKHLSVSHRTPTEVALAMLVDQAMDYELSRYGRRHLYCHTSWTHVGPLGDRPDLEVGPESILSPDMGDLVCLNVYTYARGVRTSPQGSVTGSAYQGYLEQLAAEATRPILVTQVGMSTSPIAPKPSIPFFGGNSAREVAATFTSVWNDIRTARGKENFCGLVFFEFQDEWWKSAKHPEQSKTQDPDDPEQWFGVYAVGKDHTLVPKGAVPATVERLFAEP